MAKKTLLLSALLVGLMEVTMGGYFASANPGTQAGETGQGTSEQDLGSLPPEEAQAALNDLSANYTTQRKVFEKLHLTNIELCKEARTLEKACPLSLPISAEFFSAQTCESGEFGRRAVKARFSAQGSWKLRVNHLYESSAFSTESTEISFTDGLQNGDFFVPFKKITTMEVVPVSESGGLAQEQVQLHLSVGDVTIIDTSFAIAHSQNSENPFYQVDLSGLDRSASACHPNFTTIMSRVEKRVSENMGAY